jgi:hypothetical protein
VASIYDTLFAPQQPLPGAPQQPNAMLPQPMGPMPRPVAPPAPPAGQPQPQGGGFNLRDLALILGALGDIRSGQPAFTNTWMRNQQVSDEQRRRDEFQQAQIANTQADNKRADEAAQAAAMERRLRTIPILQGMLTDEAIDTPEAFDARMASAQQMGSLVGIEPGFLNQFRPAPDKFAQRAAKKVVARIEGDKRFAQHLANPEFQGQIFEGANGERKTYAEWKAQAGQSGPAAGSPPLPMGKPDMPNTPEERMADAIRRGDKGEIAVLEQAARRLDTARRDPRDPVLNEIAELRRDQMRNTPAPVLPAAQQRRVDAKAKTFESLPVVKNTQKMAEAVSFANSLDINTKNPADDQALIYAFAKAMDPDSVVREGEYATVQKYAQSWAERFGFDVKRIYSNTAFLTPQARANMKKTIQAKFAAGKTQYDNVRKSYINQVNKITGQQDGEDYLTDYGAAFPQEPSTSAPSAPPPNPYRQ